MSILERVRPIISDKLAVDLEEVKPSASFMDDLGADSLDIIDLAMELENAFGLSIPDRDYAGLRTVADAVTYIATRVATPA